MHSRQLSWGMPLVLRVSSKELTSSSLSEETRRITRNTRSRRVTEATDSMSNTCTAQREQGERQSSRKQSPPTKSARLQRSRPRRNRRCSTSPAGATVVRETGAGLTAVITQAGRERTEKYSFGPNAKLQQKEAVMALWAAGGDPSYP